jgi:hypothetical protein
VASLASTIGSAVALKNCLEKSQQPDQKEKEIELLKRRIEEMEKMQQKLLQILQDLGLSPASAPMPPTTSAPMPPRTGTRSPSPTDEPASTTATPTASAGPSGLGPASPSPTVEPTANAGTPDLATAPPSASLKTPDIISKLAAIAQNASFTDVPHPNGYKFIKSPTEFNPGMTFNGLFLAVTNGKEGVGMASFDVIACKYPTITLRCGVSTVIVDKTGAIISHGLKVGGVLEVPLKRDACLPR